MPIQKITVLEFAPTADEIWYIPHHVRDGYTDYDAETGLLSLMDTAHHAKQRPEIITTYAGGKATNVARVLDRLIAEKDNLHLELITFLPPPEVGMRELDFGGMLKPSTAAGIYVQCLQIAGLKKVKPHFEVVNELSECGNMQTTRRCIELTWAGSGESVNFSPRIVWSQEAAEAVQARTAEVAQDADLVVMAGAPPIWDELEGGLTRSSFYAKVIESLPANCQVSIDTRGDYLRRCLLTERTPRFILMNTEEFGDLSELLDVSGSEAFPGTFLIHDESGCWAWDKEFPDSTNAFHKTQFFASMSVSKVFSTIGAGDAMHAGFLKAWVSQESLQRAVVYSQAVAGVSVSNEKATHGIDANTVDCEFQKLWNEHTTGN